MKKCVLILARGGSKSVPRKNVVDLNGRPLITYAIRAGKESGIDDVWVSTEDSEIGEVSKREGALIHERAEYLAQDLSTDLECFRDFFENKSLKLQYKSLFLTQYTAWFESNLIQETIALILFPNPDAFIAIIIYTSLFGSQLKPSFTSFSNGISFLVMYS